MTSIISASTGFQSPTSVGAEPDSSYFTHAKIKRCALVALALIATLATAALVGVVIAGSVSWPFVFIAIPLVVVSFFSFWVGLAIKDYEDPKECATMRKKAEGWNFSEIKKEHSDMKNMLKLFSLDDLQEKFRVQYKHSSLSTVIGDHSLDFILDNQLASLQDIKDKFLSEVSVLSDIDEVYQKFGHCLAKLSAAKIITPEMRNSLSASYEEKASWAREKAAELDALHHKYSNRQTCLFRELDKEIDEAKEQFATQQKEARRIGHAGTEIAVAVKRDPKDPLSEQWKKDSQTRALGHAGTEIAIAAASLIAKGTLDDKLKRIEEKRSSIRQEKKGLKEQESYDLGVVSVDGKYAQKLKKLSDTFAKFRNTLRV